MQQHVSKYFACEFPPYTPDPEGVLRPKMKEGKFYLITSVML